MLCTTSVLYLKFSIWYRNKILKVLGRNSWGWGWAHLRRGRAVHLPGPQGAHLPHLGEGAGGREEQVQHRHHWDGLPQPRGRRLPHLLLASSLLPFVTEILHWINIPRIPGNKLHVTGQKYLLLALLCSGAGCRGGPMRWLSHWDSDQANIDGNCTGNEINNLYKVENLNKSK